MSVRRSPPVQPVGGVRLIELLGGNGLEVVNAPRSEGTGTARHVHDAPCLGKLYHLDVIVTYWACFVFYDKSCVGNIIFSAFYCQSCGVSFGQSCVEHF